MFGLALVRWPLLAADMHHNLFWYSHSRQPLLYRFRKIEPIFHH
jgi:hypothetical protein